MSTRPPSPDPQDDPAHYEAQRYRLGKVWEAPTGWRDFSSVNNDIVGLWYTLDAFFFFAIAGVLALLMRTQLGVGMLAYCVAASFAGKMTPRQDADLANVLLYWHFMFVTAALLFALLTLFPLTISSG